MKLFSNSGLFGRFVLTLLSQNFAANNVYPLSLLFDRQAPGGGCFFYNELYNYALKANI